MTDRFTQKDIEQLKKSIDKDRITEADIESYKKAREAEFKEYKKSRKAGQKPASRARRPKPVRKGQPPSDVEETRSFNKGGMADYIKDLL